MTDVRRFDRIEPEARVEQMYDQVALTPEADFQTPSQAIAEALR
jgi:hypothetical protein